MTISALPIADPLRGQTTKQLLFDILFKRVDWARGKTLARMLVEGLDDLTGATGSHADLEPDRRREFLLMMRRVAADIESHPRRDVFFQFLVDAGKLTDLQVFGLAKYLYSRLVNGFKGELAELLVRPMLREWIETLDLQPGPVEVISGWRVEEPVVTTGGSIKWDKGADALIVRMPDGPLSPMTILGAVEIKSYRNRKASEPALVLQLHNHVRRLRTGLRIDGVVVKDYVLRQESDSPPQLVDGTAAGIDLLAIRTTKTGGREESLALRPSGIWLAEIPFSREDIAQAAYRIVQWFLALGADSVFSSGETPDKGRVKNPWPHVTIDVAGRFAVMEELHHLLERMILLTGRDPSKANLLARENLAWIYNSLTVGYENAIGTDIQRIEDFRPPKVGVELFLNEAHDASRKAEFERCDERLEAARAVPLTEEQGRRISWLEGLSSYRRAEFDRALAVFPLPRRDPLYVRDMATRARLLARLERADGAEAVLADIEPLDQWNDLGISLEAIGVRALIAAHRSSLEVVQSIEEQAQAFIEQIDSELAEARRRKVADPYYDAQAFNHACLDLGCSFSHLGQNEDAIGWLRRVRQPQPWMIPYLDLDPWLERARALDAIEMVRDTWRKTRLQYR